MATHMNEAGLQQRVERATAVYTPLMLTFYDWLVFGFAMRLFRCPPDEFFSFYEFNVSEHHLDIGVGTGSLLKYCMEQDLLEQVALMDLNPACLKRAAKALRPVVVKQYQADMLQPFPMTQERYLSVGLNLLLHCVPGSMREKGVVFQHIKRVLAPGGIVFGSTVFYRPGVQYLPARLLMNRYNQMGAFNNQQDQQDDLRQVLSELFENIELEEEGCVTFFRASDGPLD